MAETSRRSGLPEPAPAASAPAASDAPPTTAPETAAAAGTASGAVPWYRDGNKLTLISVVLAFVVALLGDDLVSRAKDLVQGTPTLGERVEKALEECREDGFECRTTTSIVIANGSGELTAVGVDLIDTRQDVGFAAGSAVLVFDATGGLRWKSPIQSFAPGYGLGRLDTDVTNHLFVQFAVTNHSGIAWVIDPSTSPVRTFGSVGGSGLVIDGYDHKPSFGGLRRLTAFREGWPANARNPTTSRDVFEWNGTEYVHTACEVIGQSQDPADRPVLKTIKSGTGTCRGPIGKYSVDLDGDRDPATDPP